VPGITDPSHVLTRQTWSMSSSLAPVGDGETDDTDAFRKAIAASDKIFIPRGTFLLSGELRLNADTHLFGLTSTHSNLGTRLSRSDRRNIQNAAFSIVTVDEPNAAPGLSHLAVNGDVDWRSGRGTMMLAGRFPRSYLGMAGDVSMVCEGSDDRT
jgi:hypothetical protein